MALHEIISAFKIGTYIHKSIKGIKSSYQVGAHIHKNYTPRAESPEETPTDLNVTSKFASNYPNVMKVVHFITGKTFSRCLALVGAAALFMTPAGPVIAGAAVAAAAGSIMVSIGFEVKKMRHLRHLNDEKTSLQTTIQTIEKGRELVDQFKALTELPLNISLTHTPYPVSPTKPILEAKASWFRSI
ncbi:MAG: hypothetical protein ACK4M7_10195, partial [Burkholderiales bacterium]